MNKQNSKLLLKKIIQQNNIPSKLQSFHSLELLSKRFDSKDNSNLIPNNQVNNQYHNINHNNNMQINNNYINNNQCTFNQNNNFYINNNNNHNESIKDGLTFQQELMLQSKILKQIDSLSIQSKVQIKPNHQIEIIQLPLQCLQSRLKRSNKLKVHSSIDGMQTSKQISLSNNTNHYVSRQSIKQKSLAISDLILFDNGYMRRSNGLNEHQRYEISQQIQLLTEQYYQNLKQLRQQQNEQLQLIQKQLKQIQTDQLINKLNHKINQLQSDIIKIKSNQFNNNNNQNNYYLEKDISQKNKSRSKTPQIKKIKSNKNNHIININHNLNYNLNNNLNNYINNIQYNYQNNIQNNQNILKTKIYNQLQNIQKQKQKSIQITAKLSKAKSSYQQLQHKLNLYSNHLTTISSPITPKTTTSSKIHKDKSPTFNHNKLLLSPKSPQKINCKTKYFQFLQKQKIKYYQTLKNHIQVIYQQIDTFKSYQKSKCQQLKQEIQLLKNQIRYIDVKGVQKFFFTSPFKGTLNKGTNNKASRDKSTKKSTFQNNYSQKLISTHSSNSLHSAIPPLSPRSPQIYSRSPQLYSKSPQYSTNSVTPRSIKIKDMNKMSDKSTNYSQTKIQKSKSGSQNVNIDQIERKMLKGKQNNVCKKVSDKSGRKVTNHKINIESNKKVSNNRKVFTYTRRQNQMRTEPSDDYCINSENEFRY